MHVSAFSPRAGNCSARPPAEFPERGMAAVGHTVAGQSAVPAAAARQRRGRYRHECRRRALLLLVRFLSRARRIRVDAGHRHDGSGHSRADCRVVADQAIFENHRLCVCQSRAGAERLRHAAADTPDAGPSTHLSGHLGIVQRRPRYADSHAHPRDLRRRHRLPAGSVRASRAVACTSRSRAWCTRPS